MVTVKLHEAWFATLSYERKKNDELGEVTGLAPYEFLRFTLFSFCFDHRNITIPIPPLTYNSGADDNVAAKIEEGRAHGGLASKTGYAN